MHKVETELGRMTRVTRAERINSLLNCPRGMHKYTMMDLRVLGNREINKLWREYCGMGAGIDQVDQTKHTPKKNKSNNASQRKSVKPAEGAKNADKKTK